ncbi:MAG: hypothetical protein ABJC26_01050, partial [Gemmatimonadaceae bacterium]
MSFGFGAKAASLLAAAVLMMAASSGAARAQDTSVGATASRESLAQRVATDEAEIARGNLKTARKKQLDLEIATIKDRLENGDFHTGDLVVVTVTIPNLSPPKTTVDTSTVRANSMISITELPDLSVKGVLKSEIQEKVKTLAEKY